MQERDERQTSYCCDKSEKGMTRIESWKRKYEEELPVIYTVKFEKQCFRRGGCRCGFRNRGETSIR